MNLVIVESPAKGKTIKNILGKDYQVLASFGHVRDLPEKKLGVEVNKNFEPEYVIPPKARKTIKTLKEAIANASETYLATDYDREGEAIAWHIAKAIGLSESKIKRITFHEITKPAVLEAIKHPRNLDTSLVNAQQGRRVLDRLVGYKLSPFLWQKVAQGLSAGRVQSVAVRMIVEKEREIKKFVPQEYWLIEANLLSSRKEPFKAILCEKDGQPVEKLAIKNAKEAQRILDELEKADYYVKNLSSVLTNRYPAPPFTTSTLQQEAAGKFHFSPKQTMRIAQGLYEDGLITYMRTDSVSVSNLAVKQAQEVIKEDFGQNYLQGKPRFFKTKSLGAQEAHEAIRPTNLKLKKVSGEENRVQLYNLIWQRMIASQTKEAVFEQNSAKISAKNYGFEAKGLRIKFDGYLKVYGGLQKEQIIPELKEAEKLQLLSLEKNQRFTEPPVRFSEATLIRELEKRGIGRPSTYAPTVSVIIDRGYVEKIQSKLQPKEIGEIVTDLLVKHFPEIVDYNFTAKMEDELDQIAMGRREWQKVIGDFYEPFSQALAKKQKEVSKQSITEEETDKICPTCGKKLKIKLGRYGKFLACSGFPECKYTAPLLDKLPVSTEKSKEKCLKCGKALLIKEGKFGHFLACEGYPKCKFTKNLTIEAKAKCPNCGGKILRKTTRRGRQFWGCGNYPKCKTAFWEEPQEKKCPKCQSILTMNSQTKVLKCSQCEYVQNPA